MRKFFFAGTPSCRNECIFDKYKKTEEKTCSMYEDKNNVKSGAQTDKSTHTFIFIYKNIFKPCMRKVSQKMCISQPPYDK